MFARKGLFAQCGARRPRIDAVYADRPILQFGSQYLGQPLDTELGHAIGAPERLADMTDRVGCEDHAGIG